MSQLKRWQLWCPLILLLKCWPSQDLLHANQWQASEDSRAPSLICAKTIPIWLSGQLPNWINELPVLAYFVMTHPWIFLQFSFLLFSCLVFATFFHVLDHNVSVLFAAMQPVGFADSVLTSVLFHFLGFLILTNYAFSHQCVSSRKPLPRIRLPLNVLDQYRLHCCYATSTGLYSVFACDSHILSSLF